MAEGGHPAVDPRVSFGNLLILGSLALGLGVQWISISNAQARLDERLVVISRQLERADRDHDEVTRLADAVKELADERAAHGPPR